MAATITREVFLRAGLREAKQEIPILSPRSEDLDSSLFYIRGDSLDLAQIISKGDDKGTYITLEIPSLDAYKRTSGRSGTYEELLEQYNRDETIIKNSLYAYLARNIPIRSLGPLSGEILSGLDDALHRLSRLKVAYKTETDKRELLAVIEKLRNSLRNSMADKFVQSGLASKP